MSDDLWLWTDKGECIRKDAIAGTRVHMTHCDTNHYMNHSYAIQALVGGQWMSLRLDHVPDRETAHAELRKDLERYFFVGLMEQIIQEPEKARQIATRQRDTGAEIITAAAIFAAMGG